MIFTKIIYPNDFWHKIKIDNFEPYNVFLAIATNILVLFMTAFVLQAVQYLMLNPFCYSVLPDWRQQLA